MLSDEERRLRRNALAAKWRAAHRSAETHAADSAKWYKAHPGANAIAAAKCRKNKTKLKTYKRTQANWYIAHPAYEANRARKNKEHLAGRPKPKVCEVCGCVGKICFDHCHVSGKFRGWLCHGCNTALGHTKDSPTTLRKLAKYLEFHSPQEANNGTRQTQGKGRPAHPKGCAGVKNNTQRKKRCE